MTKIEELVGTVRSELAKLDAMDDQIKAAKDHHDALIDARCAIYDALQRARIALSREVEGEPRT